MKRALASVLRYVTFALCLSCARNEPAAPQELPQSLTPVIAGPTVAFLGDSITAGYGLALDQAYPALVRDQLGAARAPFRLINAGVSGDTSAGGLRRVDWLLTQKPAVVVVELGANDGLRGAPTRDIEQNLREIVRKVRTAGATPLLLGMRLPPSYGDPYASDFATLYDRVAAQLALAYVPYFMRGVAGVVELNQDDGLHPTAEGHRKLAANVAPALANLLAPH